MRSRPVQLDLFAPKERTEPRAKKPGLNGPIRSKPPGENGPFRFPHHMTITTVEPNGISFLLGIWIADVVTIDWEKMPLPRAIWVAQEPWRVVNHPDEPWPEALTLVERRNKNRRKSTQL